MAQSTIDKPKPYFCSECNRTHGARNKGKGITYETHKQYAIETPKFYKRAEIIYTNKNNKQLHDLCSKTRNLYNQALWYYRQDYFNLDNFLKIDDLYFILKNTVVYRVIPSGTAKEVLRLVLQNMKAYWRSLEDWRENPSKYRGKPKMPNYKRKDEQETAIFNYAQLRIKRDGTINLNSIGIDKPLRPKIAKKLDTLRIVPLGGKNYKYEVTHKKPKDLTASLLNQDNVLSIDMGVTNIITAIDNISYEPFLISGGVVKSINQYYNKEIAKYQRISSKQHIQKMLREYIEKYNKIPYTEEGKETTEFVQFVRKQPKPHTKRMHDITNKRNKTINTFFHDISKYIINYCKDRNIGTIVLGYNEGWKQKVNIGKINNQKFVQIPYFKLKQQLQYKSDECNIHFIESNESYTSKCSALDNEEIGYHDKYMGERVKRSFFKTSKGIIIHADVNAALNIMRKVIPKAVKQEAIVVSRLTPRCVSVFNGDKYQIASKPCTI